MSKRMTNSRSDQRDARDCKKEGGKKNKREKYETTATTGRTARRAVNVVSGELLRHRCSWLDSPPRVIISSLASRSRVTKASG